MRLLPPRPAWLRLPQWAPGRVSLTGWYRRTEWRQLPLTLMIACLLCGLGSVQLTFQLANSLYRTQSRLNETRAVQRDVAALKRDLRVLSEVQAHASDPEALRQMARCLGFVGVGETVVLVRQPNEPGQAGVQEPNCQAIRLP